MPVDRPFFPAVGSLIFLPSPTDGETLEQYLQRFSDAEFQQIRRDPGLCIRFSQIIHSNYGDSERAENSLENLWNIIERANNIDNLLYFIRRLVPVRQHLLESLAQNEQKIQRMHTFTNAVRFLGSAIDIAGTTGGILVRNSHPGFAGWAFRTATIFGFLGLASIFSEMNAMKITLDNLMRQIAYDQEIIAPIQRWYKQTKELELAMQTVFPFDFTSYMVADFTDTSNEEMTSVGLLATLIRYIADQDSGRLRDAELIQNLINFSLFPASQDWFEWIVLRRHPIVLDITRIAVQLHSGNPLRFAMCESIPTLALADQNISSFPIWGRIILNSLSMADSLNSLLFSNLPDIVDQISHLRRHLRAELSALQRIAEFVEQRRSRLRRRRSTV